MKVEKLFFTPADIKILKYLWSILNEKQFIFMLELVFYLFWKHFKLYHFTNKFVTFLCMLLFLFLLCKQVGFILQKSCTKKGKLPPTPNFFLILRNCVILCERQILYSLHFLCLYLFNKAKTNKKKYFFFFCYFMFW